MPSTSCPSVNNPRGINQNLTAERFELHGDCPNIPLSLYCWPQTMQLNTIWTTLGIT